MSFACVSRRRQYIMGFAMMWIVWFHMTIRDDPGALIYFAHRIGYYGVDLFLLVSGMGLWHSLSHNGSVLAFYKRRALRIFPAYLVVLCIWYALHKVSAGAFLLSISTLGYWFRTTHFDWFIPTLVLFYLIAPWYYKLYLKYKNGLALTGIAVCLCAILCLIAALTGQSDLFGSIVRFPVFCLGFWFGEQCEKQANANSVKLQIHIIAAALALGFAAAFVVNRDRFGALMQAGLNAWPALIAIPPLALVLAAVYDRIADTWGTFGKIILFPLGFFGRYSLEIYLLHEPLTKIFPGVGQGYILLAALAGAALLHEAIAWIIRKV